MSFGYIPRNGIAASYGSSIINFWGTAKKFSTVAALFYIPLHNIWLLRWLNGKETASHAEDVAGASGLTLGQEDTTEKEMATHSSILSWEIPWTEESGGL